MISELLWYQFSWFLNLSEAESWFCHFFKHCIAIFVLLLKQIHDVDFLLKMKHFVNVLTVCFLSEFNQNILVSERSVRVFSLWFIWIFFCDIYWSNFFFVSDRNSNSTWVEIILCIEFSAYDEACRLIVVCVNCTLFNLLQTLAWFCSCWMSFIAV